MLRGSLDTRITEWGIHPNLEPKMGESLSMTCSYTPEFVDGYLELWLKSDFVVFNHLLWMVSCWFLN